MSKAPPLDMFRKVLPAADTRNKDFYDSLGIKYRVVNIVSGALNNAAAKKYDLLGQKKNRTLSDEAEYKKAQQTLKKNK